MAAVLFSTRFAVTTSYLTQASTANFGPKIIISDNSENDASSTQAFYGDLSNFANAMVHNITRIRQFPDVISIAKLCPQ
jgi:hypothetical protein